MDEEGRIEYGTSISDEGFEQGAKKIQGHIDDIDRRFEKSGKNADEVIERMSMSLEELGGHAKSAVEEFAKSKAQVNLIKKELDEAIKSGEGYERIVSIVERLATAHEDAARAGRNAQEVQTQYVSKLRKELGDQSEEAKNAARDNMMLFQSLSEEEREADACRESLEKYRKVVEETSKATGDTKKNTDENTESIKKHSEELKNSADNAKKAAKSHDDLAGSIEKVPGPIGQATKGLKALTKETLVFLATPLGMTLAAISAALAAVSSWFHRTEEGEETLNVMTASFTGTLNTLLDVVDNVGEWLYKAFTNPKEALLDLWNTLKNKLMADMKRVGEMGAGIIKIFKGDVSEGLAQAANAWNGIGFGGLKQRASENSKKQADLAKRQNALDKQQRDWIVEREKKEARIAELREKIYDSSTKESEKVKAIAEAKKITNDLYNSEVKMAKEQHDIIASTNKLSHTSISDKTKEQEALAKTIRLEKERSNALRTLDRQQNSLTNKAASAARKEQKEAKEQADRNAKLIQEQLKYNVELEKLVREGENAAEEARISAIRNEAQREREERRVQHQRTIRELKSQQDEIYKSIYEQRKKAYETTNNGKKYENTEEGQAGWGDKGLKGKVEELLKPINEAMANLDKLTAEEIRNVQRNLDKIDFSSVFKGEGEAQQFKLQLNTILSSASAANSKLARENEKRTKQLIASHQSYTDKKIAIDEQYKNDIMEIDAAIYEAEKKGEAETVAALKRARAEVEKQRAQSQAELSLEQLKNMPEYIRAFEDLDNTSTETLEHLIEMFEKAKTAAATSLNPEQLREYTNTIRQMQDKINERDPFKALVNSSKKLKEADEELSRAQKNLWKVRHGMAPVIGTETKENGELVEVLMSEKQAEDEVRKAKDNLKKAQKGEKKAWAEVRSEIDEVANSIGNLGSSIGGEAGQILQIASSVITFTTQTIDTVKQITESINNVKKGVDATMNALQSSNAILAIIGAAYSIFQSISSLFGESEEEKQARLKREEMMRIMTSSVEQYRLEVIKARQEEEAWFASSSIMKLAQQWELSSEAQKSYYAIARQQTESLTNDIQHWNVAHAEILGSVWMQRSKFFKDYTASIKEAGNAFDMLIKNERDELETLSSFIQRIYGTEMFDANGNLNTTVIDSFLADYAERIQHDDEQILKNLSEMAKQYQEWQKALQEYVDEQYGGLSDDIVDALWSWYDEGTDVLDAFRDNARDTFRGVADDMMKELVNSLVFDRLKEKLTGLFTAYSENVNKNGMSVSDALKLLLEGTESALAEFEGTVTQELPTLQALMTQIGEMSDRLFGDGKEDATDYFDDIRSAWVDAVTGMKGDTADFGREMARIMFENLVNSNVFNKEFDKWLKNWSEQYEEALKTGNEELKKDLEKQKSDKIEELTQKTKEYAEMAGYASEADEELSTSLSDLRDTIVDALLSLDDDASDIGKKIGSTLIREMMEQMLASETYAGRMAEIKEHWQKALSGDEGHTYESVMKEIAALNNDIASDDAISALAAQWKELNAVASETSTVFSGLRSTFLDALTDMEGDAEAFRENLNKNILRDLIDKQVLSVPITIDGTDFENFEAYIEHWNKEYAEAVASGDKGAIDALMDQLMTVREQTLQSAEEFRQRYGKAVEEVTKEIETAFDNLGDTLLSSLMNVDTDVESFMESITQTVTNELVKSYLASEEFQKKLVSVKNKLNEAIASGNPDLIKEAEEAARSLAQTASEGVRKYTDALRKAQQDTTFTDMEENLVTSLMDMDADIGDFAENMKQTIVRKLIESFMVSEKIRPLLESIQKTFDKVMGMDGKTMNEKAAMLAKGFTLDGEDFLGVDSIEGQLKEMQQLVAGAMDAIGYVIEEADPFAALGDSLVTHLTTSGATAEEFTKSLTREIAQEMLQAYVASENLSAKLGELKEKMRAALDSGNTTFIEETKKELTEFVNDVAQATKKMTDVFQEAEEVAKDTSFTGLSDSWVSTLLDMEATAEDWAENVGRMMAQKIIEKFVVGTAITPLLEEMQEAFDEVMSDDNATLSSAIKSLSPYIDKIKEAYPEIQELSEQILNSFGVYREVVEETVEVVEEEAKEGFDDLKGAFVSSLLDMEADADKFGKDIAKTMIQSMIDKTIENRLGAQMARINEEWYYALERNDTKAMERIRADVVELQKQAKAITEPLVDMYRELQDIEKITDDTITSMRDGFLSALVDMSAGAKDFAVDIRRTFSQKLVEKFVMNEKFDEWLTDIQARYEEALSSDASVEEIAQKMDALAREWTQKASDMQEQTNRILDLTGLTAAMAEVDGTITSMKDSYLSALMDMTAGTRDFADDVTRILTERLLSKFVLNDAFEEKLSAFQKVYDDILGNSELTEAEMGERMRALASEINQYAGELQQKAEAIFDVTGWKESVERASLPLTDLAERFRNTLLSMDTDAGKFGREIAATLVEEMIQTMLEDRYAEALEEIRAHWAKALAGDTAYSVESVRDEIEALKRTIENDASLSNLASDYKRYTKEMEQGFSDLRDTLSAIFKDIGTTAEDTAKSVAISMREQMLDALISQKWGEEIARVNQEWADALNDGSVSRIDAVREKVGSLYAQISRDDAIKQLSDDIARLKYVGDTTFKDMAASLTSALTDITRTSRDWATDIAKTMADKIISELVIANGYQKYLDNLQKAFNAALDAEGATWQSVLDNRGVMEAMDEMMDAYPAMAEAAKGVMKGLGLSVEEVKEGFQDLRGSFVSTLTDMTADAGTFGRNMAKTMISQMVDAYIDNKYRNTIARYNQEWAEALEDGNTSVIESLKDRITDLYVAMANDTSIKGLTEAIRQIDRQSDDTFTSMADSWASALMDMESDADAFVNNIAQTMAKKLISETIVPQMINPLLTEMQNVFNYSMEQSGATYGSVIAAMTPFLSRIREAYGEIQPIVSDIMGSFGIVAQTTEEEVEYALQDMRSNFVSSLMDMQTSAEDFSKSIGEILAQSFIDNFVLGSEFDQQMEYWQQHYESILHSDLSEDERKRQLKVLREAIASARDGYAEQAMAIRELFGLNNEEDQQATVNMADKITHDQADELLGINMAQEMTLEQILATLQGKPITQGTFSGGGQQGELERQILATLQTMGSTTQPVGSDVITQIFNRLGYTNDYLRAIRESNQKIFDAVSGQLDLINAKIQML